MVVAIPVALRNLPTRDQDITAVDLLDRVTASRDHAYSGYVETRGNLQLPITSRFTDVGALFGGLTRMRVWWRGSDQWRVNKLLVSGETDLIHEGSFTTEWSYEGDKATGYYDPAIRLPRTADLLPPAIAARLLEDVDPAEVSRLPARRVAGRDALGLRVSPASSQSSIDHADLWVDPETGIPLAVAVHALGDQSIVAFSAEFRDFSSGTPDRAATRFQAPPGADASFDDVLDIADAANQYAPLIPPATFAGLDRSPAADRAVGIYGRGLTQVIVIPLRDQDAGPLREQLATSPLSSATPEGTVVTVGPLGILLTEDRQGVAWLVAGTVTEETLVAGADQLAREAVFVASP